MSDTINFARLISICIVFLALMAPRTFGATLETASAEARTNFLLSTATHQFPESGLKWTSVTEKLMLGERSSDGSCKYSYESSAPSGAAAETLEEIAVNRTTCESLVRVGTLTSASSMFVHFFLSPKRGANDPRAAPFFKTYRINSASLNEERLTQSVTVAAASPKFYTGSVSIGFTDGNNPLVIPFETTNFQGFEAATLSVGVNYSRPSDANGNELDTQGTGCYSPPYGTFNAGAAAGTPQYSLGFAGWSLVSGKSCSGIMDRLEGSSVLIGGTPIDANNNIVGGDCSEFLDTRINLPACPIPPAQGIYSIGPYAAAEATFHNQTNGLVFNCSSDGGLYLYADRAQVSARIDTNFTTFFSTYRIAGPASRCANYIKVVIHQIPAS